MKTARERRVLLIALALNAAMAVAVTGGLAGSAARSAELLAETPDMLANATAYTKALLAIGRL